MFGTACSPWEVNTAWACAGMHTCPVLQARFWAKISSCHPAADCHNLAALHNTSSCAGWRARRCHGASELLMFPYENKDFWILHLSGPGGNVGTLKCGDWWSGSLSSKLTSLLLSSPNSFSWRKMTAVVGKGCSTQWGPGMCLPHTCLLRVSAGSSRDRLVTLAHGLCLEGSVSLLLLCLTRYLSTEGAKRCCPQHHVSSGLGTAVSQLLCCSAEHPARYLAETSPDDVFADLLPHQHFHTCNHHFAVLWCPQLCYQWEAGLWSAGPVFQWGHTFCCREWGQERGELTPLLHKVPRCTFPQHSCPP